MDRKDERKALDLSKTRQLINTGQNLSVSGKNVSKFPNWKSLGGEKVMVQFSPLEDFVTEEDRERERYLCFEEHCTKKNADCYVTGLISRTNFPQNENYHLVFFKYW